MFIRASTVLFSGLALAGIAAAAPQALEARGGSSECNTGSLQCCQSVQEASSSAVQEAFGWLETLFGVNIGTVTGQVGLTCSGVGSSTSCTQQPVCCNGNSFSGAIVIGCSPL